MGSAKKTSAEHTASVEEMHRADCARERRSRVLTVTATVIAAAGLVVGGVVLLDGKPGGRAAAASDAKGSGDSRPGDSGDHGHFVTGRDGVRTWSGKLSRTHVGTPVDYPMRPPVGGNHSPVWLDCDGEVYTEPVTDENAVHSLEHGAVWVTYTGKASKADVQALAARVERTPYTLMSPYRDQKDPIMLTAWGHQRTVRSAGDPAVDAFFADYVQGGQTPEPGASCTGGRMK